MKLEKIILLYYYRVKIFFCLFVRTAARFSCGHAALCLLFIIFGYSHAQSQNSTGEVYSDGHRGKIFFPLGALSFADEVISFKKGFPIHPEADSKHALGTPKERKAAVLGCGGVLTLRFTDNALINIKGNDLYVFEAGRNVEPTFLSISKDGINWIDIGKISGGRADIDIAKFTKPGDIFHYVRLKDALMPGCGGMYPGADINAVGAIGSALQISMKSAVLFDSGKSVLKLEAKEELRKASRDIGKYSGARIVIEGHTDSVGPTSSNQALSEMRAGAVREYLMSDESFDNYEVVIQGYGESRPVASNETDEGREKNRRVDIILIPES